MTSYSHSQAASPAPRGVWRGEAPPTPSSDDDEPRQQDESSRRPNDALPWGGPKAQSYAVGGRQRSRGRTVQAYAGMAVLSPSNLQAHSQSYSQQQHAQVLKAQAFSYYPQLPRTSEDLFTSDQQPIAMPANARKANASISMKGAPALDGGEAAPGLYPSTTIRRGVENNARWAVPEDSAGDRPTGGKFQPRDDGRFQDTMSFIKRGASAMRTSQQQPLPQPQAQGSVVHMSRADAWSRFAAYEACIQVCCDNPTQEFAQHFQSSGFRTLREHLRIGCLLLGLPSEQDPSERLELNATDICWEDGTAARAEPLPDSQKASPCRSLPSNPELGVRLRVAGILLPGTNALDRVLRWVGKRQSPQDPNPGHASERKKLVVYVSGPDGHPLLQCPLDRAGSPLMAGNSSWTYLELNSGQLRVEVNSREGLLATGTVSAELLWQMTQHLDIQEDIPDAWLAEMDLPPAPGSTGSGSGKAAASLHVQLTAGGSSGSGIGQLVVEVQRTRRPVADLGLVEPPASSTNRGSALNAFGTLQSDLGTGRAGNPGNMATRMNRNIVYDCLLSAALEVEKCGPTRLTIEGPWQWLLTAYADQYNVSNAYRVLVHMQWLLQPRIARTSQLCLSTITDSWVYLLACKLKGELTAHEDTMLTRIRRDVEELLKVAFVRYYMPQHDGSEDDTPCQYELQSWDAQHLQAAVQLYQEVAPYLMPSARDWLALCWQTAAQKRWRALLAMGDPDRVLAGTDITLDTTLDHQQQQQPQQQASTWRKMQNSSGIKSAGEVKVYQLVINLCKLIQEDITFDLNLKHEPGLLPTEPELPKKTAEEYCAQFLLILRLVLEVHPPSLPTPHAVELLAAVAKMQRYLDVAGLQCDVQHPGHLNAFQLFQPHVLRWISASASRLTQQSNNLESNAKAQGANAALGASNSSSLVTTMMKAVSTELRCYEQVLRHWPRFAPPLEAAVCQVLRGVLAALSRQCETAKGDAPLPAAMALGAQSRNAAAGLQRQATINAAAVLQRQATLVNAGKAGVPGLIPGLHKRATSVIDVSPRDVGPLMARAPAHARGASVLPPQYAVAETMRRMSPAPPPPVAAIPRTVVLLKEAVLLNSLKHIMVTVPELEDDLTQWATWSAGQAQLSTEGQLLPDGIDIGVHFAQLVKELRSGYSEAVATCAGRLAEVLRGMPATNIRVALEPQRAMADPVPGYPAVSSATAQKQALEEALLPVLGGIHEALGALQAALDTRVCIATGRALWDYVGKDLHLFVSALHERNEDSSATTPSAWRARQNADTAAHRIDEVFCHAFTDLLNGAVQACDLAPPAHMDKVHKLLQRNNAVINMAFIPF